MAERKLTDGNGGINRTLEIGDTVEVIDGGRHVATVRRIWDGEYSRTVALVAGPIDTMTGPCYTLDIHDGPFAIHHGCIASDSDADIEAALETLTRYEAAWTAFGRGAASADETGRM
jgi:hypothetical protein